MIMETDRKWIIVRIDGKITSISTDYRQLAAITAKLALTTSADTKAYKGIAAATQKICADTVGFDEVWKLRNEVRWEDLMLFGTDFQKSVWRKLWELTHAAGPDEEIPGAGKEGPDGDNSRKGYGGDGHAGPGPEGRPAASLISYSDFADLCRNRAGVRAVAHAIGLNPVSVIIPCHLVIPKEAIDKMNAIRTKAESTIFKGEDLCLGSILKDESIDFGEYSLGRSLKRWLIDLELTGDIS